MLGSFIHLYFFKSQIMIYKKNYFDLIKYSFSSK